MLEITSSLVSNETEKPVFGFHVLLTGFTSFRFPPSVCRVRKNVLKKKLKTIRFLHSENRALNEAIALYKIPSTFYETKNFGDI